MFGNQAVLCLQNSDDYSTSSSVLRLCKDLGIRHNPDLVHASNAAVFQPPIIFY